MGEWPSTKPWASSTGGQSGAAALGTVCAGRSRPRGAWGRAGTACAVLAVPCSAARGCADQEERELGAVREGTGDGLRGAAALLTRGLCPACSLAPLSLAPPLPSWPSRNHSGSWLGCGGAARLLLSAVVFPRCVCVVSCQQNLCVCKGLTFPSSRTQDCCGMQTEDILFICGSQVPLFDLNAIFLDCLCCGCWEHRDGRSRASPPCPCLQQAPVADAEGRHHGGRRATRPRQIPRSPGICGSRRCGSSSGPLAALDFPWELLPSAQLLSESGFTAGLGCAGAAGAMVLFPSLLLPLSSAVAVSGPAAVWLQGEPRQHAAPEPGQHAAPAGTNPAAVPVLMLRITSCRGCC